MGQNKKKNQKLSQSYYQQMCPQRELPIKEHETEYALIEKNLGSLHYAVACSDGKIRLAVLRGRLRYKVFVNEGDIVLVGLRDYQDGRCDIMLKYHRHEIRELWSLGEIPDEFYSKIKHIYPLKCYDLSSVSSVNDSDIVFLSDNEIEALKSRQSSSSLMTSFSQQSYTFINDQQSEHGVSEFDTLSLNTEDINGDTRSETSRMSDFEVIDI